MNSDSVPQPPTPDGAAWGDNRKWYFEFLFLPIITPIVLCVIAWLFRPIAVEFPAIIEWISGVATFLVVSLFFGGVQYAIFMIGVMIWWRNKTSAQIKKISWVLPVIFTPLCILGIILANFPYHGEHQAALFRGGDGFWAMMTGFTLLLGYFYVILSHMLGWLLSKR